MDILSSGQLHRARAQSKVQVEAKKRGITPKQDAASTCALIDNFQFRHVGQERAGEENIVCPRWLAIGESLYVKSGFTVAYQREGGVFCVNSVEGFRELKRFRSIRKGHRVDAVALVLSGG